MTNNIENGHGGYVGIDREHQAMNSNKIEPERGGFLGMDRDPQASQTPPGFPAGHPMQTADRGFLGQDACKETDTTAAELGFQMQLRQQFRRQFMKTQLCRYHLSMGGCRKGAGCEFAHDQEELTAAPDLRRTSICRDWQEGRCQETAETCKFAHGNAMLRRTLEDATTIRNDQHRASSESSSVPGPGSLRGGFSTSSAARLFTNWEQQLLKQQVEQEKLKDTIREQQKTIDSLLRLQLMSAAAQTPGLDPGQRPVLPQSGNPMQSTLQRLQQSQEQHMTVDALMRLQQQLQHQAVPQNGNPSLSSMEQRQWAQNMLQQSPQPANSQSYSSDAHISEQFTSPGIPF